MEARSTPLLILCQPGSQVEASHKCSCTVGDAVGRVDVYTGGLQGRNELGSTMQCAISSVQLLSPVRLFATSWTAARQASLSITNSRSFLKLMSIESVMPSNYLNLCCLLLLPPSSFPSLRVFSNESTLRMRWPKYWSFSFNISPSNEYSGLISFKMDSQESSPTPQFKSINSSALSFLYSPTLISIHNYWKNHTFDYTHLCQQSDVWFLICCLGLSQLFFQGARVF